MAKNPMPTVEYQGEVYKLRSRKTEVPDFTAMSETEALMWIIKYTTPRGYQKEKVRIGGITLNPLN
ncbi:MAG: hypothetical protein LUH21_17290 [Clostridiales bacterium]|nr:hypothetical protein [Clostridiales bacterium]